MKRLRGEISSHSLRTVTSSTNAIAAREVSTPTTMPRTAIDKIRAAVLNPARMGVSPWAGPLADHDAGGARTGRGR